MQKIVKILLKFGEILTKFWQNFDKILTKFCQNLKFCQNFVRISPIFCKIFINFCIHYSIFQHFSNLHISVKFCQKIFNAAKFCKHFADFWKFCKILQNLLKNVNFFFKNFQIFSRNLQNLLARRWFSCTFWKMLQNAYLDAKIGFDPAENEPPKEWCVLERPRVKPARERSRALAAPRRKSAARGAGGPQSRLRLHAQCDGCHDPISPLSETPDS